MRGRGYKDRGLNKGMRKKGPIKAVRSWLLGREKNEEGRLTS